MKSGMLVGLLNGIDTVLCTGEVCITFRSYRFQIHTSVVVNQMVVIVLTLMKSIQYSIYLFNS